MKNDAQQSDHPIFRDSLRIRSRFHLGKYTLGYSLLDQSSAQNCPQLCVKVRPTLFGVMGKGTCGGWGVSIGTPLPLGVGTGLHRKVSAQRQIVGPLLPSKYDTLQAHRLRMFISSGQSGGFGYTANKIVESSDHYLR